MQCSGAKMFNAVPGVAATAHPHKQKQAPDNDVVVITPQKQAPDNYVVVVTPEGDKREKKKKKAKTQQGLGMYFTGFDAAKRVLQQRELKRMGKGAELSAEQKSALSADEQVLANIKFANEKKKEAELQQRPFMKLHKVEHSADNALVIGERQGMFASTRDDDFFLAPHPTSTSVLVL